MKINDDNLGKFDSREVNVFFWDTLQKEKITNAKTKD